MMNDLKVRRRRVLAGLGGLLAASVVATAIAQEKYPSKPIRLVVTNQPGTGPDLIARALAVSLNSSLGQPVIVEDKVGANGNIAASTVAKSASDGYTILLASDAQMAINPHVYEKLPFNPQTDFVPLATLASQELFLCVASSLPVNNLQEFVSFAKSSARPLSYGSASSGTQSHLMMEMLKTRTGIPIQHVPYRGGSSAAVAVMSGEIVAVFGNTAVIPLIKSGKLRALASTGVHRSAAFPAVPTVAETLPGFEGQLWIGVFAPAGTSPQILSTLRAAIQKFTASPDSAERLATMGFDPLVTTPEQFRDLMRKDYVKYGQLIKDAGVKPE